MAETRLRVTSLESGVAVLFETCEGGLTSPMEARGATGGEIKALARRASFLAFLLASLLSLPITSAKALPTVDARLRECRMEPLVDDLDFGVAVLESEGIIARKMKIKGRRRRQWESLVVIRRGSVCRSTLSFCGFQTLFTLVVQTTT